MTLQGIILIILIALIAIVTMVTIQAEATVKVEDLINSKNFNIYNISKKKLLIPKGYLTGMRYKKYGSEITVSKYSCLKKVCAEYLNNLDKYDGIPLDLADAELMQDEFNLERSSENIGIDEISFCINKNKKELYNEINQIVKNLHYSSKIENTCKLYFKEKSDIAYCMM